MSGSDSSSHSSGLPTTRAPRALVAVFFASLLALVFAGSALAVAPVDIGGAHDYSVLATTLTSNGPTAMSDNLGVSPGTTFAGDTAPIVLGETHLGDTQAEAAMTSLTNAYGDAVLRSSTGAVPADLAGASLDPGVYNASGAVGFTAGGVLTLDAHGDPNAVFIFQIGAALSVGADAQVKLVGGADACNVFWAVGAATSIGANAKFAGTVMATSATIGLGAGSRLDGRVLGKGAVTLSGNAIRTACSPTLVVTGPAGPAGPAGPRGADGPAGAQGIQGAVGANGAVGATGLGGAQGLTGLAGANGATGLSGVQGLTGPSGAAGAAGATGLSGTQGLTGASGAAGAAGATGLSGPIGVPGLTGAAGAGGPAGPAGVAPVANTTKLCVTKKANRRKVHRGGVVRWTIVVRNCGALAARRVSVTDRLRKGAGFKSRGGGSLINGQLVWTTATLAAGASRTYTITTRFSPKASPRRFINIANAAGANTRAAAGRSSTVVSK